MPFKLTYGIEAVIPLEIGLVFEWVKGYDGGTNHENLWACLDLLQEAWEKAYIRIVVYRQKVA